MRLDHARAAVGRASLASRPLLRGRAWPLTLVRVLFVLLALPLVSSGALPTWARLAGVEAPHVCHCSVDKHDCVCERCDPGHEDARSLTTESLSGRCGDDDVAFAGKAICAVLPASGILAPTVRRSPVVAFRDRAQADLARPPPTPPPRSPSSAA